MKTKLLFLSLVSLSPVLYAQNAPDLQTSAYRNGIAQDEVRKQAEQARAQLQVLLEDFQQNQLQTPEFVEVQKTIEKLASLSDEEIVPLVQMLKDAGNIQQPGEAAGKLANASQSQKNIQSSLKVLSDRLAMQMNQAFMAKRIEQLILSQTGNLRQTKDLAASGKPIGQLPGELMNSYTLSQSEQGRIHQETDLMLATLEKLVSGLPENERGKFSSALAESKRLNVGPTAVTAAGDMTAGKFAEATGSESKLLDGLQNMLLKIKESQPLQERMSDMAQKMQQLASQQSQLAQSTEKKDDGSVQTQKEMQKQLSDQVEALQKELAGLDAPASNQANDAQKSMQSAVDTFQDHKTLKKEDKNAAAGAQKDAASKLQAAADTLKNEAKKMDDASAQAAKTAQEAMQDLAKLDSQVRDAMNQQNNLNSAPNADAQKNLADQTAKLQDQAATMSPQAAQSIGQAAAQMTQNDSQSPSAAQSLSDASAQIEQQMASMQQAMDQQAALQAQANALKTAQDQTKQAADSMQKNSSDLSGAVNQTMAAQQSLTQAQNAAANAPGDVAPALKEAQAQLEASVLQAAQSKGDAAADANAQAQASMGKAMKSLNDAMAAAAASAAAAAPAMAGTQGQGGKPGQGQKGQQQGTPSQSTAGGNGMSPQSPGKGFMAGSGSAGGPAQVASGLKPKDRDAVSLLQKEKAPAEYQGMVQQYLKNLAEGASPGHGGQ